MTRFLLLNFEDFNLKQDITKTIQPFNPFCICCLDRNGPMFNLESCGHRDYLDLLHKPELKQFNQLVCFQCHSVLKKIKCFQEQVIESYNILLSGEFSNTSVYSNRISSLTIQKVVDDLHLPPDIDFTEDSIDRNIENNQDIGDVQNDTKMDQNFTHNMADTENNSIIEENFTNNVASVGNSSNMEQNLVLNVVDFENNSNMDQGFTHNMANIENNANIEKKNSPNMTDVEDNSNMEKDTHNMADFDKSSNIEQNFSHNVANIENDLNMEPFTNLDVNMIQEQNRLNKNIKTALEILERNNQSFVSLSSQLQFLNGEHLSFLESSLLSKEILTDLPLVPAKSLSTDMENGLLNNSKLEIEIYGTDKMFYDSLGLSPDLMNKDTNVSNVMDEVVPHNKTQKEIEPKTKFNTLKPKKERKVRKPSLSTLIKRVKLSHEELDRERVLQAQSNAYLKYKFRCETCIVGFNYKENLEDHIRRKHGSKEGDSVICEICSQLIQNAGSVTEHNYRHYTRYECIRCKKRYHTHDEVIQHCVKHQTDSTDTKALKNRPTVQLRKGKLKMKPCKG